MVGIDAVSDVPIFILPERQFVFPGPDNTSQQILVAERVDLLQWRELTLRVRVHAHSLTGSNQISIGILPQSWTEEDPGLVFIGATAAGTVTISAGTPSPGLLTTAILTLGSNAIAALGAVRVTGTRASVGTMNATLSIDICAKDT